MALPRLLSIALALMFLCGPPAYAGNQNYPTDSPALGLSVGSGFEFESGDYGTGETIDSWRVPLLIEWAPNDRWGISLEIPYLHLSGTGETILLGGGSSPMQTGRGRMSMASAPTTSATSSTSTSTSEEGLGDSTLNVDLTLLGDAQQTPKLLGLLYAKLPTADKDKGLGTGEFDWGGGLGVRKIFADWSTYAQALYITPGTSTLYDPSPYWEWLASVSYRAASSLRPGLSLAGGTAAFNDVDDPLKLKARLGVIAGAHHSYSFSVTRGLSDASPEWGCAIFAYFDF